MNRNASLALLAAALTLFFAPASYGDEAAPDAAAITAALDDFHQALAAGDRDRALSLLHPDALITEMGSVETREHYASEHLAEDIVFARAVPSKQLSRELRQNGQTAWITSTYRLRGRFHEREIDQVSAETAVLTNSAAGWRIRSLHWSTRKAVSK